MKRSHMKLSNEGKLRVAVHSALLAGLAAGSVGTAVAQEAAPATDQKPTELDTIEVTGSRLKRSSLEGALPVTIINRADIDLSGDVSVADVLRSLSLNSFGSFRQQSGSSAQSLGTVDLRGLGPERTLVLIDGKRAPKAPYAASAQDINAIPLGAVERIEILQDGASAIYGSDAIAGVVNIILRKDFQGSQLMYGAGFPSIDAGDTEQLSAIMGVPTQNGNLVMGASYNTRDIIFTRDHLRQGIGVPGSSIFGNNYVAFGLDPDGTGPAPRPLLDPDGAGPVPAGTLNAVPGGCTASSAFILTPSPPNPTTGVPTSSNGFKCQYDFTRVAADEASTDNMALFAKGNFEINRDWSMYITGSVSRSESFGRYAPAPAAFFILGDEGGAPMSGPSGIDHDGNGTFDTVYVYHRFDALGNRDDTVDGNVYDLMVGSNGHVGPVDIDFGGRYNEYKVHITGRNYVVLPIVEQFASDGTYNFRNPLANPASTLNSMKATIGRESTWEAHEFWASGALNDLFKLPGGGAGLAIGGEFHQDYYKDQYDSLSEGGVIGGSAGNSAGLNRTSRGFFTELRLPALDTLEVTAAVRYDSYSDVGGQASPKLSARFQPVDLLTLRAAYGQGFRAPTLDVLSAQPAFSAEPIRNDGPSCVFAGGTFTNGTCSISVQINTTVISNPNLEPEESDQYSFGFSVDPADWVGLTLDYYSYNISNVISFISVSDLVDLQNQGLPLPPAFSLTRNAAQGNRISAAVDGTGNAGEVDTSGLNLDVDTRFEFGALGKLKSKMTVGYILKYETTEFGRDVIGELGNPEMRMTWNTAYEFRQATLAWNQNYIGDTARNVTSTGVKTGHVPSHWTHDLQLSADMPFNAGSLSLGAQNIFNKKIPVYAFDGRPYNFFLYEAYGRVPYFKYTLKFG